jgi:hypothetical protein
MLKITLASGEVITGTPNYVTESIAEIKIGADKFRTIARSEITAVIKAGKAG